MKEFFLSAESQNNMLSTLQSQIGISESETYILDFESDFSNSKIIRDFVGAIFDTYNITHPWRGRFILITDELINNSIEHGSSHGDVNRCIITAGKKKENNLFFISLEVHDTGNGKKQDANEMNKIKEERMQNNEKIYMEKRGRWLFHITEKIVDKLSFAQSEKWWLAVKIEKCILLSDNTSTSCEINTLEENNQKETE